MFHSVGVWGGCWVCMCVHRLHTCNSCVRVVVLTYMRPSPCLTARLYTCVL